MQSIKTSKLKFTGAKATNTRLMGVVGLIAYWRDEAEREIAQIFHLDYEVYGIDGFYHLIEPDEATLNELILGVTGGLGGTFVDIDFNAFVYLVKSAYHVDMNSIEAHVDFDRYMETFDAWQITLNEIEIIELHKRLAPPIDGPYVAINYMMMRLVGKDHEGTKSLWYEKPLEPTHDVEAPYTLIKNTSTLIENDDSLGTVISYRVESLIDFEHKYQLMVFEINLEKHTNKIIRVTYKEKLTISSIEASFNLNKPEHLIVTTIKDSFFERRFAKNNPEMMKQTYAQGQLYIEFNPDNNHVTQNPYYLNGDIFALYFFTNSGQLIIASFLKETLDVIDALLLEENAYEKSLQFICELKTDDPILFSFINSQFDNIFDFLSYND